MDANNETQHFRTQPFGVPSMEWISLGWRAKERFEAKITQSRSGIPPGMLNSKKKHIRTILALLNAHFAELAGRLPRKNVFALRLFVFLFLFRILLRINSVLNIRKTAKLTSFKCIYFSFHTQTQFRTHENVPAAEHFSSETACSRCVSVSTHRLMRRLNKWNFLANCLNA